MICPHCKKEILDGASFCSFCGKKISGEMVKCSKCKKMSPASSSFCIHCGSPLNKTADRLPKPLLVLIGLVCLIGMTLLLDKKNATPLTARETPTSLESDMIECNLCNGPYCIPGLCPICQGSRKIQGAECIFCVDGHCDKCKGQKIIAKSRLNEPLRNPDIIAKERELYNAQLSVSAPTSGTSTNIIDNRCRNCYGSGKCSLCAGRGEKQYDINGHYEMMDCPICNGSGRCQACKGRGY